jgi:hypothetical protein
MEVDGRHLIVTLPDRHDIERLTLVDPNGRHFATKPVQTGVRQVRFELCRIRVWRVEYLHYDPGVYTLVGAVEARTYRQTVMLEPDIRITDVEQVREEELPRQYKGLKVTVTNVGTGPTWVYGIASTDAPFDSANSEIENEIGRPFFSDPEPDDIPIIGPGEQGQFIGSSSPLIFPDSSSCDELKHGMEVTVGVATDEEVRQRIRLTTNGEALDYFLSRDWLCDEIEIEMIDDR